MFGNVVMIIEDADNTIAWYLSLLIVKLRKMVNMAITRIQAVPITPL
jgi:hypothetical protein